MWHWQVFVLGDSWPSGEVVAWLWRMRGIVPWVPPLVYLQLDPDLPRCLGLALGYDTWLGMEVFVNVPRLDVSTSCPGR